MDERELMKSIVKVESVLEEIWDKLEIPKKECPICKKQVNVFEPYGEKPRPNAMCPSCRSLERTRAQYLYWEKRIPLISSPIKLLHFAPEQPVRSLFENNAYIDYYPVDFNKNYYGIRDVVDITQIQYEAETFDIIICNHVLEHIPNEQKALSEIHRVLKTDGVCYLSVPTFNIEKTFENPEYNTAELRSKYYGHRDHVRKYGQDVAERLASVFNVEKVDLIKEAGVEKENIKKYGLKKEIVYCLRK